MTEIINLEKKCICAAAVSIIIATFALVRLLHSTYAVSD